jgi:hypothetical protein
MDAPVLLTTETVIVFVDGYLMMVNIPDALAWYPTTPNGDWLKSIMMLSVEASPAQVAVTGAAEAPEGIAAVPRAMVPLQMVCVVPAYCGMFRTPPLSVAGPEVPVVDSDWTGTCEVDGVPVIPAHGSPVAFVRVAEAGVPSTGAVSVGDVSVSPETVAAAAPRATDVLPIVTVLLVSAEFGIPEAATESVGVVVLVATLGTSQVGQLPELAMKLVTDPPPVPAPVKVQVVPEHDPAPPEKLKVKAPAVELMELTPALEPIVQVKPSSHPTLFMVMVFWASVAKPIP